jgi:hypothetical protein
MVRGPNSKEALANAVDFLVGDAERAAADEREETRAGDVASDRASVRPGDWVTPRELESGRLPKRRAVACDEDDGWSAHDAGVWWAYGGDD